MIDNFISFEVDSLKIERRWRSLTSTGKGSIWVAGFFIDSSKDLELLGPSLLYIHVGPLKHFVIWMGNDLTELEPYLNTTPIIGNKLSISLISNFPDNHNIDLLIREVKQELKRLSRKLEVLLVESFFKSSFLEKEENILKCNLPLKKLVLK